MLITLEEAKMYLRVDFSDEDELITSIINSAEQLCMDIARIDSVALEEKSNVTRIAVLYATAYLYEHREKADHKELTQTLRNLLFNVREEIF